MGKIGALLLTVAFIIWFLPDLASVYVGSSLFEKLLLTTPVVLAIRVAFVCAAIWLCGLVLSNFWRGIGIRKIGSAGIEFGKLDEISSKTQSDLAAKDAKIKQLETINRALQKQMDELLEFSKRLIAMRGGKS